MNILCLWKKDMSLLSSLNMPLHTHVTLGPNCGLNLDGVLTSGDLHSRVFVNYY